MGLRIVTVPGSAAGADWVWTGLTDRPFKLATVRGKLVTSATVANRAPAVQIADADANILAESPVTFNMAAGETEYISFFIGGSPQVGLNTRSSYGLPDVWLPTGCTVRSLTEGITAGDQWSAVVLGLYIPDED